MLTLKAKGNELMLRPEVLRAVENSLWYLEYIILVIGWPLPDMFDFLENKLFNKFFNRRRVTQTPSICNVPAYEMFSPSLSRVPSCNINHMFLSPTFWWRTCLMKVACLIVQAYTLGLLVLQPGLFTCFQCFQNYGTLVVPEMILGDMWTLNLSVVLYLFSWALGKNV